MREGHDVIDATCIFLRGQSRDAFSSAADTADGAQNPDLVARADLAIGAAIAKEGAALADGFGDRRRTRSAVLVLIRFRSTAFPDCVSGRATPTAMSVVARPIGQPYLRTTCPADTGRMASLCPRGIAAVTSTERSPTAMVSCAARSRKATATSSAVETR